MTALLEEAPARPKQFTFFRRAMVNMLSIALKVRWCRWCDRCKWVDVLGDWCGVACVSELVHS